MLSCQREVRTIDISGYFQIISNAIIVLKPVISKLIRIILARIHVLLGLNMFDAFHIKHD